MSEMEDTSNDTPLKAEQGAEQMHTSRHKNREDEQEQKSEKDQFKFMLLSAITLLGILFVISQLIGLPTGAFALDDIDRTKCPYSVEGNTSASLVIKYIDSPWCSWCWLEEPILRRLVERKGNILSLEKYDIRKCADAIRQYQFSGTPSFVFSVDNSSKEFPHTGYIDEPTFYKIICEITGDCYVN